MTAILIILFLPLLTAATLFAVRRRRVCMTLFLLAEAVHFGTIVSLWFTKNAGFDGWISADPLGILFLSTISLLCLGTGAAGLRIVFPKVEGGTGNEALSSGQLMSAAFLLFFVSCMSAVCFVQHAGLLWVFVEATTLATAPMIYIHKSPRSLEAAWKYLLICSVGIALALFGNILITIADQGYKDGTAVSLLFSDLAKAAPRMNGKLLKAAFIFLVIGYGTKMGLAPLHTWLPDAHSEAPGFVSALLSGALLNCAFLAILRIFSVMCAADGAAADFSASILRGFGLVSMGTAAVFLANQKDYKRLLAYSSSEHMGILSFGVGLGGLGAYGALFHTMNHSLAKAALFLTAGTILHTYRTKDVALVAGMGQRVPYSAALWTAGFLAITGFPPFATFFSEFIIIRESFSSGRALSGALFLVFLTVAFFGIAATVLPMTQGKGEKSLPREREPFLAVAVPALFLVVCAVIGLLLPAPLSEILAGASAAFGGSQ